MADLQSKLLQSGGSPREMLPWFSQPGSCPDQTNAFSPTGSRWPHWRRNFQSFPFCIIDTLPDWIPLAKASCLHRDTNHLLDLQKLRCDPNRRYSNHLLIPKTEKFPQDDPTCLAVNLHTQLLNREGTSFGNCPEPEVFPVQMRKNKSKKSGKQVIVGSCKKVHANRRSVQNCFSGVLL